MVVSDQIVVLVVGVLLTSGLGGAIAFFFQSRTWEHQRRVTNRDNERFQAIAFYEEITTRFDRRLYRMRQVNWTARDAARGQPSAPLDEAIAHYREVLVDWNESVNRVFAFAEIYFGVGVRRILKDRVYEDFAAAGRAVDLTIKTIRTRDNSLVAIPRLDRKLARLASTVLGVDLALLSMIRDGTIGLFAPAANEAIALEDQDRPFAEIGDSGSNVRRLQEALEAAGQPLRAIDGIFGLETWSAVRALQARHSLHSDGVVGAETLTCLGLG